MQDALVDALVHADHTSLSSLTWLQDLPQRIQQHQLKQLQLSQSEGDPEEEQDRQEGWNEEEAPDQGSSLYYERQQLRLEVEQAAERLLVHVRSAAALQARVQDRMQKSAEAEGQADAEAEKLPLLRHVTRELLWLLCISAR